MTAEPEKQPNQTTQEAIQELESGKGLSFRTVEELIGGLDSPEGEEDEGGSKKKERQS